MTEPRPHTEDECREMLLDDLWAAAHYWADLPEKTNRSRAEGLLHSVLATLDGCSMGTPGFKVIPSPHEEDETYHRERGENWWPNDIDLVGGLHEQLYSETRKSSRPEDQVEVLKVHNHELRRLLTENGVEFPDYLVWKP